MRRWGALHPSTDILHIYIPAAAAAVAARLPFPLASAPPPACLRFRSPDISKVSLCRGVVEL